MTERYEGIKASTGYAIGNIYLFTREEIDINQAKITRGSSRWRISKGKRSY